MTVTPPLPHWETVPEDLPGAIRQVKAALRARIEASGRSVEEVFGVVERRVAARVAEIEEAKERGESVWPVVDYADIENGTVSPAQLEKLRRRGCLVVRGHFDRAQALRWDADIVDYVERNAFFENYSGPGDDFFGTVGSKPEIYPVYWSTAQMEARQSERMARVQSLLNSLWKHESEDGVRWFDPERDAMYPDRIRRRPPGTESGGLGTHCDPGTLDLWMTRAYQKAFRHLFDGTVEEYDPWDAAYRTEGPQYPGSTMCSAFRTFQGWTALSDMAHDQGVLHTVPIPEAMAYLMLRPLLADVPEDDMCGVTVNQVFPSGERWHPLLMKALTGIPDVRAGDSVWWHCDMIHSVAPVKDQQGWGNVMYIPAAPWCPRNEEYAAQVREAFLTGSSPGDFPEEHYERDWTGRFTADRLNDTGRRGLGMEMGQSDRSWG
ncbi:Protein of unknown function [Streptomyces sp. yr375]|uniref:DUF1479 domain-containing protein n=1 Tax=Streptomyces sp. yr375 TaxID=1761906 RepID=UPI0008C86352|nr:DUF1479 domain-containing protein [Streptomyces sp. yr375]SER66083.1 Protein of unknown function [Streptomyces sp. yr375]